MKNLSTIEKWAIVALFLISFSALCQKDSIVTAIQEDTVFMYPNPAKNFVRTNRIVNSIIDMNGMVKIRTSVNGILDLSDIDNGIYFINRKRLLVVK